jgi:hypothetical protein
MPNGRGFRNPFRFTFRPGTGEIWSGDVGWNTWEEINRTPDVTQVRNYGWPCYEGTPRMGSYDSLNLDSCEALYAQGAGAVTAPYYAYSHSEKVVPGETCTSGSSSVSGLAFYTADAFPPAYKNALFFSDYSRNCIWVMYPGSNGLPDPATRQTFLAGAAGPVFLTQGPDGALYYADLAGGTVRRVAADNSAPTARIAADPTSGTAPLTVAFDGRASSDPEGAALTYAWDLDGDGAYDDSTSSTPSFTYSAAGAVTVRLGVAACRARAPSPITVGAPPTVTLTSPAAGTTWAVGDTIGFSGSARDSAGAALPASALRWALDMRHCSRTDATNCHTHHIQDYVGVAAGSFVAPDHEYPSHLELSLTATDTAGLSTTQKVQLDPRTSSVALASVPSGLQLSFASETLAAPFTRTVIARSVTSVSAPSPQGSFSFGSWATGASYSDGPLSASAWGLAGPLPPVPASLVAAPGSLALAATTGTTPVSQTLAVSNGGAGALSFSVTDDAAWLSVTPASGSAPASLTVTANPTGLAAGTYTGTVTVTAAGVSGSPKSVPVTLTVAAPTTGLVGAWGFDETAGTTTADASGKGNTGTLNGPVRTTAGRFGGALDFDGVNDWVTVNDSTSLRLTTGLTLEGWAYPTGGSDWRTLALKETAGNLAWALYPFGDGGLPSGHAATSGDLWARGTAAPALNTWTHFATTYDGATIRMYVNGVQTGTRAQTGTLRTSTQPLRFGGNAVWPEWFRGRLDEIRVYDRALTAAQIQADMAKAVGATTLLRAAGTAGAKKPAKAKRRATGPKIKRYRGRYSHHGKWLGP